MSSRIDYEKIGAHIHEFYAREYPGFLPHLYQGLPEYMKEDNRAAARRMGAVLASAGLRLEPCDDAPWDENEKAQIRALMEANIELLAEAEHDGWIETRLRQGWKLTLITPQNSEERQANFNQRLHHLLIEYSELPEMARTKDRDVRNYVDIISQIGYSIVVQNRSAGSNQRMSPA